MECSVPVTATKPNLLDFGIEGLIEWCVSLGEPRFRAIQLIQWIHQTGINDFNAMSNLSKKFREYLLEHAEIRFAHHYARSIIPLWYTQMVDETPGMAIPLKPCLSLKANAAHCAFPPKWVVH